MSLSTILNIIEETNKRKQIITDELWKKGISRFDRPHKPVTHEIKPVLEIYEFRLQGYPTGNTPVQFGEIIDTPTNDCGIIKAISTTSPTVGDDMVGSCDIISSDAVPQTGGIPFDVKYLNEYYLLTKAKERIGNTKQYEKSMDYFKNTFEKAIDINNQYVIANQKTDKEIPNYKTDLDKLHNGAMVFKINVKNTDKIIIFGDHHGSYHTFYRNILRLHRVGIINLKTWEIKDGYKLIFLGDIVDRGDNATEILSVIANFIIKNNTRDNLKIILNRGNHEEEKTYKNYGFTDELDKKGLNSLIETIKKLFALCSSAIILENESKHRYWLSHGGFPLTDIIMSTDDTEYITTAKPVNYTDDRKIWFHVNDTKPESFNISIASQIRWNDFTYADFFGGEQPRTAYPCKLGTDRGIGIKLNSHIAAEFMGINNINFVIRAHQDNIANSWLLGYAIATTTDLKPKPDARRGLNNITSDKLQFVDTPNNICKNNVIPATNNVYGPVYRIACNEFDRINGSTIGISFHKTRIQIGFPIITLSTNTDIDRTLTRDSFAVLRFDLTNDTFSNFAKENNVIDPRNKMVNNAKDLF